MRTLTDTWNEHRDIVDTLAKQLNGVAFTKAPFDIVDSNRKFYEVKLLESSARAERMEEPIEEYEALILFCQRMDQAIN